MNDVLAWLYHYCLDKKIGIQYISYMNPHDPFVCYEWPRLIIYNEQWYKPTEKPFILAHEIGHVTNGDAFSYHNCQNGIGHEEYLANAFAIKLLKQYCEQNDIYFNNIYDFARAFAVPRNVNYILETYIDALRQNRYNF